MPFQWYLCPYDVSMSGGRVIRRPAIARYIPSVPNADGSNWDEAETLDNHVIVKVLAPDPVHAVIQLDPDFFLIPSQIPLDLQAVVRIKLISLGYTTAEVDSTGFDSQQLLRLLTVAKSAVALNPQRDGIVIGGRELPSKQVADIEARLPG